MGWNNVNVGELILCTSVLSKEVKIDGAAPATIEKGPATLMSFLFALIDSFRSP
jgi:hypothetical protein